jgi:hypothetical protein
MNYKETFFLVLFLSTITLHMNSCFSVSETAKVANEWCECSEKTLSTDNSVNCDSVAQLSIQKLVEQKWIEVKEKGLPPDTIRVFKLSLDNEFHNYVENCKKK